MAQTVQLNYYYLGAKSYEGFYIRVSMDDAMLDVVDKIIDRNRQMNLPQLHWQLPSLYKTDRSREDLPLSVGKLDRRDLVLIMDQKVSDYWPDASQIDTSRIQLLVNAKGWPTQAEHPDEDLRELPSTFRKLQLQNKETARWFKQRKAPSKSVRPSLYLLQQNQETAPIYNGRPAERTGLPIQLYHPVFDHFLQTLEATDELTAAEYRNTQDLTFVAQGIYRKEASSWEALVQYFYVSLNATISRDAPVANCKPDGLIQFTNPDSGMSLYCSIIEVKNEVGIGACDPSIQAAEDYGICWSQDRVSPIRESCCCPSLLIAIAGPWMCILGAVYLDYVTVQPLTDYIWLGHHPQQDMHLRLMTRVFRAAKESIAELSKYYKSLSITPPKVENLMRFFPYIRQYENDDGTVTHFNYNEHIDRATRRPVFTATTDSGQDIVVKFAEQYNIEAHWLLAQNQLAPIVLFYKAPTHSRGLHCVIMERVQSVPLDGWDVAGAAKPNLESVQRDVQKALDILHSGNWVFGDLRSPNVLVIERDSSANAMLVDFDWCGREGIARYPAGLNDDGKISWPDGVERGSVMRKQHDLDMFEKLFK